MKILVLPISSAYNILLRPRFSCGVLLILRNNNLVHSIYSDVKSICKADAFLHSGRDQ